MREKMKEEKKIQMMVSLPIVLIWERERKKREQESIKKTVGRPYIDKKAHARIIDLWPCRGSQFG